MGLRRGCDGIINFRQGSKVKSHNEAEDREKKNKGDRVLIMVLLHIFLMVYSVGGILSKLAAAKPFMSTAFICLYLGEILLLAFYAVGWQQFIKRMPLSFAYANKAVTIVWGFIWGVLLFHEQISPGRLAGCILVIAGVIVYGFEDGKESGHG